MLTWKDVPDALGLVGPEVVSFVGGGGKTTALFALATHRAGRCIVTTTTKMGAERTGGLPVLLDPSDADLADALQQQDAVIVWSGSDGQRAFGIEPDRCARYLAVADTVAVEADGSRRRPFKAPRAYEPVVTTSTTSLVGCVGRSAIGVPIEVGCHRPDLQRSPGPIHLMSSPRNGSYGCCSTRLVPGRGSQPVLDSLSC